MKNQKTDSVLDYKWHGKTNYHDALEIQENLHAKVSGDLNATNTKTPIRQSRILGFEHPKVITLGVRGNEEEDLEVNSSSLKKSGYQVVKVRRGGQAVLHNPGQLVIYPIVPIRSLGVSVKCYVDILEKCTQSFLSTFGISAVSGTKDPKRLKEPGLYTEDGKIAFFGIQVKNGTTLHGVAINIINNLEDFDVIKSCGVSNQRFDKLERYSKEILDLECIFKKWCREFSQHLDDFLKNNQICSPVGATSSET